MSDRYQTPSWDNDPEELGSGDTVAGDAVAGETVVGDAEPQPPDQDLDASSENVFDGWPLTEPAVADPAVADPAVADRAVADEPAAEVEAPEQDETELPDDPPSPFADRVSDSSEHAPGELTVPPGYSVLEGVPVGEHRAVGIVVARFNGDITTRLLESALEELDARGVPRDSVTVMPVPGAFELPLAAMALAKTRRFACIIALGCVIRGDTPHFDYVSGEAASGLQLAAIETGVPVAFGLLTLDRAHQAESRIDKGADAVRTGLEMADVFANLRAAAAR
jgi:6,7-dimethyl-8-ribityllumazine synthase